MTNTFFSEVSNYFQKDFANCAEAAWMHPSKRYI